MREMSATANAILRFPGAGDQSGDLVEQARWLQRECPELFTYLEAREQKLQRSLRRIPSPADLERAAVFDIQSHFRSLKAELGESVNDLATKRGSCND